jgi:hypothetical protein
MPLIAHLEKVKEGRKIGNKHHHYLRHHAVAIVKRGVFQKRIERVVVKTGCNVKISSKIFRQRNKLLEGINRDNKNDRQIT